MHVVHLYGWPGGQRDRERNQRLLLAAAEWLHSLGEVPGILIGDMNMPLEPSGLLGPLAMAGWRSVLGDAGCTCLPSHGQPSTIDHALLNPQALGFLEVAALRWDCGLATHALLELRLRRVPNSFVRRKVQVQRLDGQAAVGWTQVAAGNLECLIRREHQQEFDSAIRAANLEEAWRVLQAVMLRWLGQRQGMPDARRQHAATEWRRERPPQRAEDGSAAHAERDELVLKQRRLKSLLAWVKAGKGTGPQAAAVRAALVQKADRSVRAAVMAAITAEEVEKLLEVAEVEAAEASKQVRQQRRDSWHQWVTKVHKDDVRALYRWIKGGATLGAIMVPVHDMARDARAGAAAWAAALQGGSAAEHRAVAPAWEKLWTSEVRHCLGSVGGDTGKLCRPLRRGSLGRRRR